MPKEQVIIVHGMGQQTAKSLEEEFVNACNNALALYGDTQQDDIRNLINVIPVSYNDLFEEHRQTVSNSSLSIKERLAAVSGVHNILTDVVTRVSQLDSAYGDDGFFQTHWLDVILYCYTVLGERARIRVGKAISKAIEESESGSEGVHVLGHSLGTAVVHDTLAKLYTPDYEIGGDLHTLSTSAHKIASVHMIANVSRLLQSFVEVKGSAVRPGSNGCTNYYLQYRHTRDPITWPRPFIPSDSGNWISPSVWNQRRYALIQPTSITAGNPHGLAHYILNPSVHLPLFEVLFGFSPKAPLRKKALSAYQQQTLSAKADRLQISLDKVTLTSPGTLADLFKAAIALKDFVLGIGEEF